MIQILFFVVRHGRTQGNEDGRYRAWSNEDFAQLDAAGRDDIREAGIFLKRSGQKFPLIISDDLDRTTESKQILAEILDIRSIETDKRLRPINVGDWTGKKKSDHPLNEYLADKSKIIPGGESLHQFNHRQSLVFDNIVETVARIHQPILVVGHGSTVSYLHNFNNLDEPRVGYEGLVDPGGVLAFTKEGIIPLTRKRGGAAQPFKDGTSLSGFVTDEENRPPRACWNCRWFVRDINGLGGCTHPVVRIDPDLQEQKQADGTISVGDQDCCDSYQSALKT